jgi:hypothetical protein
MLARRIHELSFLCLDSNRWRDSVLDAVVPGLCHLLNLLLFSLPLLMHQPTRNWRDSPQHILVTNSLRYLTLSLPEGVRWNSISRSVDQINYGSGHIKPHICYTLHSLLFDVPTIHATAQTLSRCMRWRKSLYVQGGGPSVLTSGFCFGANSVELQYVLSTIYSNCVVGVYKTALALFRMSNWTDFAGSDFALEVCKCAVR